MGYTDIAVATVLIASPDRLPGLTARTHGEVMAFADGDVLKALEVITSKRPTVVALEREFSETSRGAALITRIKADPTLIACDIQIVSSDGATELLAPATAALTSPPPQSPIDYRGTRKAERYPIIDGVEVLLEGRGVQLVNLSLVGAQVVSPAILKPNQRVRVALSAEPGAPRIKAVVAWAAFEIPQGTVRYRAGLELFAANEQDALIKFLETKKR